MRNALCITEGTQDHPVAAELGRGKVVRSFRRSLGLAANVLRASAFTEFKSEKGLFEPYTSPFFFVDFQRVQRVLRKITKGLYCWCSEKRLPDNYVVLANPMVRPDEVPALMDKLDAIGSFGPRSIVCRKYGDRWYRLSHNRENARCAVKHSARRGR
jgi:hypothetical protein